MPELDLSNYRQAPYSKFVRSGKRVYYADDYDQLHVDLKRIFVGYNSVDDAGVLVIVDGKLVAQKGSSTLNIPANNIGRDETNKILAIFPPIS